MKNKNDKNKFRTSDLLTSTCLLYFNHAPIKIECGPDSSRFIFVFEPSPEIEKIQLDLLADKLLVSPRKFVSLMRSVKSILLNQNENKLLDIKKDNNQKFNYNERTGKFRIPPTQ